MKNIKIIITNAFSKLSILAAYLYKRNIAKISWKEYKLCCLELAEIDDQIARNELDGNIVNGKKIIIPPKNESIKYRYLLFIDMYKKYSREEIEQEKKNLLTRLEESKQYKNEKSVELEVHII